MPHWLFSDVKPKGKPKTVRELGEQQWEIISFVYRPTENKWIAVSTAYVPWMERFETLVSGKAKKFSYDVEGMEALGFSPEVGETVNVHFHYISAVIDHFEAIINALEEEKEPLLKKIGREEK